MSKLRFGKGLVLYAVISALLIIAGIVVYALFGFHYASEEYHTIEVGYDALVTIQDKETDLEELCEKSFSAQGLKFKDKQVSTQRDSVSIGETGDKLITYTFDAGADAAKLRSAATAIESGISGAYGDADIYVSVHLNSGIRFYEAAWRGAIALAVAAIVVLVYHGFRYGVASAVAGLCAVVDGALITPAILALTRIPVYGYMPLLFAAMGMVFSLLLWIIQSARMRRDFKDPSFAGLTTMEAVGESCRMNLKLILLTAAVFAVAFIILGAIATAGVRLIMLTALIPLVVGLYSALFMAPAALVPVKGKIDRMKSTRKRYTAKKKADAEEQ